MPKHKKLNFSTSDSFCLIASHIMYGEEAVSLNILIILKGALDNILKFCFWLNFIYHVKRTANLPIQTEKLKNYS